MSNIVFKYLDRQILTENPLSLVLALEHAKGLFNLDAQSDLYFYVNLPRIGLVELSEASWKNLEYASLVTVIAVPPGSSDGKSNTEESNFYDRRSSSASNSTSPSQFTTKSSINSILSPISSGSSSIFLTPGQRTSLLQEPTQVSSQATTVESFHREHLKGSLSTPLLCKLTWNENTELAVVEPNEIGSITVFLEYPNRRKSVDAVPVSMVLKVEQRFQVMLGDLAQILHVKAEHIELCLIRGSKATKISPIASPAQLEMKDTDWVRIRVRSPIVTTPIPTKHISQDGTSSPIWNESFKSDNFGRSLVNSSWGKRPTLPSNPSQTKAPASAKTLLRSSTSSQ